MAALSAQSDAPALSVSQVRACDARAMSHYGMCSLILMENAGRSSAAAICDLLSDADAPGVCILTGTGNNGGDGFVAARHLLNTGHDVAVWLCGSRHRVRGDALSNLITLERMNGPIQSFTGDPVQAERLAADMARCGVLVDALLGTGTRGAPREPIASVITRINARRQTQRVLALDIPSGLDGDTGVPADPAVRADATITFAACKPGLTAASAASYTGPVTVASIGIGVHYLT